MSLIEIKKDPSRTELRWFGALFVLFFAFIGAWALWKFSPAAAYVTWAAAAVVASVFYVMPSSRRWIYLGWMYAVFPIGWAISQLLLMTIFYLVMTPIGLAMRLSGYDPMRRRFDPDADSYWTAHHTGHRTEREASRYFRQF